MFSIALYMLYLIIYYCCNERRRFTIAYIGNGIEDPAVVQESR
jgi:hypothetical protein